MAFKKRHPGKSRASRGRSSTPGMKAGKSKSGVKNRYYVGGQMY